MYRIVFGLVVLAAPLAAQTPESRSQTPGTIMSDHGGGIVANGAGGATTVIPDHQGGGTILGRDRATMLVPDGIGGFTAHGPSAARPGLRDMVPAEPRELLGGTRPPRAESLRGGGSTLR